MNVIDQYGNVNRAEEIKQSEQSFNYAAGRLALARELLEVGIISTPDEFQQILDGAEPPHRQPHPSFFLGELP